MINSNNYEIISDTDFIENVNFNLHHNRSNIRLPREMFPDKTDFEKEGFIFHDIEEDKLVYETILPIGWKIEKNDGTNWIDILDERNFNRVSVYCPKSFSNEISYMNLLTRYNICSEIKNKEEIIYFGNSNEKIFIAGSIAKSSIYENLMDRNETRNTLKLIAQEYGNENYVDFRNVHAYWEDNKKEINKYINK